jgi:polar amino acid transport system substrate-binding protein
MKKLLCIGLLLSGSAWAETLILTTEDAPPTNFTTDGGKTITGSATEIVRDLFKRANVEYTLSMYPWERAITMAEKEKNTCVYSTTRTEAREKKFLWVGPVAPNDWVLFAMADNKIELKTLDDAKNYKVGGYRGDAVALFLEEQKFKLDNGANDEQSAQKLKNGRIDLWATGIFAGPWTAKKYDMKIKPVLTFKKTELYLACNLGVAQETIDKLNKTLQGMAADGSMAAINKKYQ